VRQVKLLEEDEDVTPLLDSFTERVIDPWMQPCKLPALSDSDIKIFLNTSTQETETLNKDNGVLDLFQGGEDYGKITYADANAVVESEPMSAGQDNTSPSARLYPPAPGSSISYVAAPRY
jgi:hypothetical protein